METSGVRVYFFTTLLIIAAALVVGMFWPFLQPLALAAVFAVVLKGLYKRITRWFGRWPGVSAALTLLITVLFIILPLGLIGMLVGGEARTLYLALDTSQTVNAISNAVLHTAGQVDHVIPGTLSYAQNVVTDFGTYAKNALGWVAGHAGDIFSGVSHLLLSSFIFLIALYYFLRDGSRLRDALAEMSPLRKEENDRIFDRLEGAVNSVIKGSLVVAFIQGVLTSIGFAIFGVPSPMLWGMVAALAALIPGVGTSLVLVPAIIFLFVTVGWPQALGLLIWGTLAVGLIDNLLGPKLVGSGLRLHPLLVLLSVLGGVAFFGLAGIFLGPLSLAFLFALLSLRKEIVP